MFLLKLYPCRRIHNGYHTALFMDFLPTSTVVTGPPNPYIIAGFCIALLCKKRANTSCKRASCRTHCQLLGGCALKSHTVASTPDENHPDPNVDGQQSLDMLPSLILGALSLPESHDVPSSRHQGSPLLDPDTSEKQPTTLDLHSSGQLLPQSQLGFVAHPTSSPGPVSHSDPKESVQVTVAEEQDVTFLPERPSIPHLQPVPSFVELPVAQVAVAEEQDVILLSERPSTPHPQPIPSLVITGGQDAFAPPEASESPSDPTVNAEHTVTVYTWKADNARPALCQFQQDHFPYFMFTQPVLQRLGLNEIEIQYYSHIHEDWVSIDVNHTLKLPEIKDPAIFVKAAPIENCPYFEQRLRQFYPHANIHGNDDVPNGSTPRPLLERPLSTDPYDSNHAFLHAIVDADVDGLLRLASPQPNDSPTQGTNTAVLWRNKGKQRARTPSISLASEHPSSIDSPPVAFPSKRPRHQSKRTSSECAKRARHRRRHSTDSLLDASMNERHSSPIVPHRHHSDAPPSDDDNMSSTSSWSGIRSTESTGDNDIAGSTGSLLLQGTSWDDVIEVESVRLWPVDFYICEIAEGFERCAEAAATHKGVGRMFRRVFGLNKFIPSTFYDNRRVWDYPCNLELRQRLQALGHHKDATWAAFMSEAERPPRA
ncbi:hypothetical protein L210DRAFT_3510134 [Boletus edulis BED1]|uniref:Uncharacterized protein n=1 Tax=Boletus edulis BED1 TaxID=1328754 RepID=A0AAD4G6P0_BOLED|nr:hypothetical protein L210DRAFT_3510134 [Boletus edulis BED1]